MAKIKKSSKLKVIALTANEFEDMELFYPYFRLLEEGAQVGIAGPAKGQIHGESVYSLELAKTFNDINPNDYDLLILPGGSAKGAPTTVRKSHKAQDIAKVFFARNKPVAAICHGPYTLVSADLVKGRRLTSYWHDGVPEEIKHAGGKWEDKEVVDDGNLVTSRWPPDLPFFMREVMKMILECKNK